MAFQTLIKAYPLWMHTFYFAHDSTWCVRLFLAARQNDFHWFLAGTSAARLIWNGFEVFNLYMALTVEREEIWGHLNRSLGTVKGQGKEKGIALTGPLIDVGMQIAGFYCVVNLLIGFMGEDSLFEWFLFTNVLIAWGPGTLWRTRGDRRGCSVGLAIVIVVATVNTFAPVSLVLPYSFIIFEIPALNTIYVSLIFSLTTLFACLSEIIEC
jgi:hypothetical protein